MSREDDNRPRLLTRLYDGQQGERFELWKKEWLDAAEGKGDEDASWAQTALGTDPQVGLTPAQVRRRVTRRREVYSSLLTHMTDVTLKSVIRAEANRNGRSAMQILERELGVPTSGLEVVAK